MLVTVVVALTIWWTVSVRHWVKGPMAQGTAQGLARVEAAIVGESTTGTPAKGAPA